MPCRWRAGPGNAKRDAGSGALCRMGARTRRRCGAGEFSDSGWLFCLLYGRMSLSIGGQLSAAGVTMSIR